ncbi:hypothetical protein BBP40_009285 [Aspergillus hancockii]|nr:hypothetical protein BBP40_009285 [Aspergillus hancockii]
MTACVNLGIQYLWVGQVCINQDNEDDLQQQIDCMANIYENATCTLVALARDDASYGLYYFVYSSSGLGLANHEERSSNCITAWMEGCVPKWFPFTLNLDSLVDDWLGVAIRWPTYGALCHEVRGDSNNYHAFSDSDREIAASLPGRILVHTQTASFFLTPIRCTEEQMPSYWRRTSDGGYTGQLELPQYRVTAQQCTLHEFALLLITGCDAKYRGLRSFGLEVPDDIDAFTGCYCRRELARTPRLNGYKYTAACLFRHVQLTSLHEGESGSDFEQKHKESMRYLQANGMSFPPNSFHSNTYIHILDVMLIESDPQTNVARRLGLGQIYLKKWAEARRDFKAFILE